MSNDRLKFRQFYDGKFHYWGVGVDECSFVGPVSGGTVRADNTTHDQWTGLYDSEGVEIYQDDLLRHPEFDYPICVTWNSEDAGFQSCGTVSEWSRCKVVGNKHEDPLVWEASNG